MSNRNICGFAVGCLSGWRIFSFGTPSEVGGVSNADLADATEVAKALQPWEAGLETGFLRAEDQEVSINGGTPKWIVYKGTSH